MILQYSIHGRDCFMESDCASICEIDLSKLEDRTENSVIGYVSRTASCFDSTFFDVNGIFENGEIHDEKIKLAILSDGKQKQNNTTLIFSQYSEIYLLNNNGKTIRKL